MTQLTEVTVPTTLEQKLFGTPITYATLRVGELAYFDSFAGLIPCKVTAITGVSGIASTEQSVTAVLTASRGAYRRGEQVMYPALHIIPRQAVHVSSGQYRIRAYRVEV